MANPGPAPGPAPAGPPRTRTLGSLVSLMSGPVMFVVLGVVVLWMQEKRELLPGSASNAANHTQVEPRTCDISGTEEVVQRLSQFLQFKTVGSVSEPDHIAPENKEQFRAALDWMEKQYPLAWEHLQVEKVGKDGWSRLLTWHGSDSTLSPVLYISHYDVVPVAAEKEKDWAYGPFDGKVVDGVVWGRGALDIKFSVTSMLEAVTRLMQQGFQPRRTIMFCFGHDEELGGTLGAGLIAPLLEQRGVKLDVVIDEGGVIFNDGIKGVTSHPVALVGTAEKAYTSLEVTFHSAGGHSSMPPTDLSDVASQFSRFIMYLHANKPPLEMRQPTSDFLKALAPYSPEVMGIKYMQPLLSNADKWPLNTWLAEVLAKSGPESAAIVRTTVVATKVHAGVADNVLPQTGSVTLNIRSHPEIPRQDIVDYVTGILTKGQLQADVRVTNATFFGPPGVVTPSDGRHYQVLKQAIQELWRTGDEPVAVAPYMLTGGTDSKHFAGLSANGILRFVPYRMLKTAPPATEAPGGMGAVANIHATNERVLAEDYIRSICTYERIFTLFSQA